jgi:hypothetical protein
MLPKIKHPMFEFVIPSSKKKEMFRPFLVREEKILLMAKTSEDKADIFRAIKQVINNCAMNTNFDIDKLSTFDLEYLFIQLRSVSVNNTVKVSYRDNEDGEIYDFDIDLSQIKVEFPEGIDSKIMITTDVGLKLKYPTASIYEDKAFLNSGEDSYYELVVRSVDKIFDTESVYDPADYSPAEMEEFLNQLDVKTFEKIQTFMNNIPRLYYKISYTNKNGSERNIELTTLSDFFTLG